MQSKKSKCSDCIRLLVCIHLWHTASLHTLTRHYDCICRMRVGVGQIANRTATIGRVCSCITCIPRRTRQWCTGVCFDDGCLRHLFTARNGGAGGVCLCFTIHGTALVRLLTRATTVAVASLSAIRLHQRFCVVCQEHAHLIAVVNFVVLLDEVVDVALGTMIGKVTSVAHTWWTPRVFVIARVMTGICGTHRNSKTR